MGKNRSERGQFPDKSGWKLLEEPENLNAFRKEAQEIASSVEGARMWRQKRIPREQLTEVARRLGYREGGESTELGKKLLIGAVVSLALVSLPGVAGFVSYGMVMSALGSTAAAAKAAGLASLASFLIELGVLVGIWGRAGNED